MKASTFQMLTNFPICQPHLRKPLRNANTPLLILKMWSMRHYTGCTEGPRSNSISVREKRQQPASCVAATNLSKWHDDIGFSTLLFISNPWYRRCLIVSRLIWPSKFKDCKNANFFIIQKTFLQLTFLDSRRNFEQNGTQTNVNI